MKNTITTPFLVQFFLLCTNIILNLFSFSKLNKESICNCYKPGLNYQITIDSLKVGILDCEIES